MFVRLRNQLTNGLFCSLSYQIARSFFIVTVAFKNVNLPSAIAAIRSVLFNISLRLSLPSVIGEYLLTSLLTFCVINIRIQVQRASCEIWLHFKSWKSLLNVLIYPTLSLYKLYLRKYQLPKTVKLLGGKIVNAPSNNQTFFVKFWVLKTALHKDNIVYRAQITKESLLCYALSVFSIQYSELMFLYPDKKMRRIC